MPKRISVAKHLTIEQRLSSITDKQQMEEKVASIQVIWLLAQGKKTEEVEPITGYSRPCRR
jgi:hypothetical protein